MPKIFATYCAILVMLMTVANWHGYVFSSLFTGVQKADKAANHYHKHK